MAALTSAAVSPATLALAMMIGSGPRRCLKMRMLPQDTVTCCKEEVFDICRKVKVLAVLFCRGGTPPLPKKPRAKFKSSKAVSGRPGSCVKCCIIKQANYL
ncbi:hypothetical protein COCNU_08G003310 [Cocos nucifera]|uniref:Uncharacterized protein n=1 Tax=Cocos nucifera TaxID=13894 RepID=A0A8K0IHX9_COCNU|nr:hypothetical protein COCNU_08G003310 [Cocos nucifera]